MVLGSQRDEMFFKTCNIIQHFKFWCLKIIYINNGTN